MNGFTVIDKKTGRYPDLAEIAKKEEWANCLIYCDMEGFAINEDGNLILCDECGNSANCPPGRFEIKLEETERERVNKLGTAIETIREECMRHDVCFDCPLRTYRGCSLLLIAPIHWETNLQKEEEDKE